MSEFHGSPEDMENQMNLDQELDALRKRSTELAEHKFMTSVWNTNFKLCYIEKSFAYFTTQDIDKQWGDDWDDAPYEHNAEPPYEPGMHYLADGSTRKIAKDWNEDGTPKWKILKIAFDTTDYETATPNYLRANSLYSVKMINAKLIPWLTSFSKNCALHAGATIDEFVDFIEQAGGTVYFPKINTKNAK